MNIMYFSAEVEPFAKSGGLGDVMGALPKAVAKEGHCVAVVMPKYTKIIPEEYTSAMKYVGYMFVDLNWRHQYCGIFKLEKDGVTTYFLDNEYYFGGDMYCFADIERFNFFCKASLDLIGYLGKKVDVIHCNDWSSAMIPVYYDAFYRGHGLYADIKIVYTIHNLRYQGKTPVEYQKDLSALPDYFFTPDKLIQGDAVNFMKGGIVFSDAVTTVSKTYAEEITTDFFSEWMGDVINKYSYKIQGILNGIDYSIYNPAHDKTIFCNYTKNTVTEGKAANKAALQKLLNLPERPHTAMIGWVSRLVDQKGIDLLDAVIDRILSHDVQLVEVGSGDKKYEDMFNSYADRYPAKVSANTHFDVDLAHKIYAASDILLVPSLFEPCGLAQLIALKYGSLPVVRETGGLKDTVFSYNMETDDGNGFSFANYNAHDMLYTVERALNYYFDYPEIYAKIQQRGMKCDYSWKNSSKKYIALYSRLTGIYTPEKKTSAAKSSDSKKNAEKTTFEKKGGASAKKAAAAVARKDK